MGNIKATIVYSKCSVCNASMIGLIRKSKEDKLTKNETGVCTNHQCCHFIDVDKLENWSKK